jgi:hypothetical protein
VKVEDTFRELSIGHLIKRREYLKMVLFHNSHLELPNTQKEFSDISKKIIEFNKQFDEI